MCLVMATVQAGAAWQSLPTNCPAQRLVAVPLAENPQGRIQYPSLGP